MPGNFIAGWMSLLAFFAGIVKKLLLIVAISLVLFGSPILLVHLLGVMKERKEKEEFKKKYGEPIAIMPAQIKEKLKVVCECGFKIVPSYSCEDLAQIWKETYVDEIVGYANTLEKDILWESLKQLGEDYDYCKGYCENLWFFDFEFVEDHESYRDFIERMINMTQGSLKFDNIKTWHSPPEVGSDSKYGKVWLSFEFQEKKYKFSYEYNKYLDERVLTPLITLLEIADPTKIFVGYYPDPKVSNPEASAIGCVTKDDLKKLQEKGIDFKRLGEFFCNV